ncbi:MAG TPA: metallophosphatase family protein [Cyanobacteria bacterium UBA11149]|nr:metallophosphatase family protein [Cyanobacteria bacterium UBA11367]HBE57831.1 metallophosphatase family protein [Cyanobacteria bacterium UBA11366]HBK66099.1 metallophosphatase family protein [Cyanobacteria bacterium UBA11166]HBR73501.1 metallophosphatase family protein [Cyanobacteria bacterium UBA11159]HBS68963.1 metallophosphatase family protein [Cyanobacteria bacterium UBA11153]HBW91469.1 metallophosphatase family protein [Cyanobacteria bacterium UBA11149]HCA96831.1 metallophosphatase f
MKIAVISCIHGNYEALNAVLSDIEDKKADKIYCLGDLVGYGPYPNAVVETIRCLDIPTCQGCWDEDIVAGLNACECSYPSVLAEKRGRLAHEWTNREIYPEVRDYLAQLPIILRDDNLCFVHGSPHSQHEYLMPEMDSFVAMERVIATGADILFCGHTHVPYVRSLNNGQLQVRVKIQSNSEVQNISFMAPLKRIVNAGSVGEPRHGRPNATYVLYDRDGDRITLEEVEYDYQKTCAAIIDKGLPPIFAWRLARGLEFAERAEDPTHICER